MYFGHALKTQGIRDEAEAHYREAVRHRPSFGEAYWSLANLKTYRYSDQEIADMRKQVEAPRIPLTDRYHLCFALGKAYEDVGNYEESFRYYARGNAFKKAESTYRIESLERTARKQAELCTREFFRQREGYGCADPAPIFIVGLPRAGSTLLEQILASHSQVEGTMELADVPRLVSSIDPGRERRTLPRCVGTAVAGGLLQLRRGLHSRHQYLPGRRRSRSSSTSCRTTSATWA